MKHVQPAQVPPSSPSNQTSDLKPDHQHFIGQFQNAPQFMKDNHHITHGYRINFNTPKKIFRSLFMLHNESVNIWSHFLPAIIIIIFLISFLFIIDAESMRRSFNQYQNQVQKGVNGYMQALNNLSLIAEYDTFSQKTKAQIQQLKQTVLDNYLDFTTKFQQNSHKYSDIFDQEVEGFKDTVKQNMAQFERAKIEFERKLAPMLIEQFQTKINGTWFNQLKGAIQKLKQQVDSDDFQYIELHDQRPNPNQISRWPIFVFLATAALCLLTSTIFHLFYPMGSKTYKITNRFDYAGINLLISGSAFPPLYYGMYCQLAVATIYLSLTIVIASGCFIVCLFEWIHKPGHQKYKAALFAGFGLSMLVPLSHLLINEIVFNNYGDSYQFSPSFPYYILLGASYLSGLYVYTVKCPERNHPGKYNLCGHSHQIWHGMVVLGIFFTYLGALQNFQMRKISVCPA